MNISTDWTLNIEAMNDNCKSTLQFFLSQVECKKADIERVEYASSERGIHAKDNLKIVAWFNGHDEMMYFNWSYNPHLKRQSLGMSLDDNSDMLNLHFY